MYLKHTQRVYALPSTLVPRTNLLDTAEYCGHIQRRLPRPFWRHFQEVQTDTAAIVNVGMVDARDKTHLGRLKWITSVVEIGCAQTSAKYVSTRGEVKLYRVRLFLLTALE